MSQNFPKQVFENAQAVSSTRCLLIGKTPPDASNTACHVVRFLHMLRASGVATKLMSIGAAPLVDICAEFSSESDLKRGLAVIAENTPDRTFLYTSAMNFGSSDAPSWFKRRLEELRKLRFAFGVARLPTQLTLICDPLNYRTRTQLGMLLAANLGAAMRGKTVSLKWRTAKLATMADNLLADDISAPDASLAERAFLAQSGAVSGRSQDARLTPGIALNAIALTRQQTGNSPDVAMLNELHLLSVAMRDHSVDHVPLIKALRRQSAQNSDEAFGPPKSAAYNSANRISLEGSQHALPITRFMQHIRLAHRMEESFPLTSREQAKSFLKWYRDKGPSKACGGVLPEPFSGLNSTALAVRAPMFDWDWGRLMRINALDARPFPVAPAFLTDRDCMPGGKFDLEQPAGRIAWGFEQIVSREGEALALEDLGQALLDWFARPICEKSRSISRFQFMMALQCRRGLLDGPDFLVPWGFEATQTWFHNFVVSRVPEFSRFAPAMPAEPAVEHQIEIVGLGQQTTGIAVNFKMSQAALRGTGLRLNFRDAESGYKRIERVNPAPGIQINRSAALFHLNADRIPQALVAPVFAARPDLYNIGFLLWEFSGLPEAHDLALDMLDEIWVPTEFLRATYAVETGKPVVMVGKGLQLPEVDFRDMQCFGQPPAGFTFLTCFDFHSSVERKNPLAAVQAFQTAFPSRREDVQLIVKTTPKLDGHWGDPQDQLGQIRKIARSDRRIRIMSDYLPFNQFLSLVKSVDCLISPHRAEGFGYIPAYALHYGIPVINTDYSGVTDYCTKKTARPVEFTLEDVPEDHAIYPMSGAKWAAIDIDALAAALLDIVLNLQEAKARAQAGRALMRDFYSVDALSRRYKKRLQEIGILEETNLKVCS